MKKVGVPETPLRSALSTSYGNTRGAGLLAQMVRATEPCEQPRAAENADGLADDVADEDSEGDG
jgi:hypothetical protein